MKPRRRQSAIVPLSFPKPPKQKEARRSGPGRIPPSFKYHRDALHIVQTPNYNVWRRVAENTRGVVNEGTDAPLKSKRGASGGELFCCDLKSLRGAAGAARLNADTVEGCRVTFPR